MRLPVCILHLNPIENIWETLNITLDREHFQAYQALKRRLKISKIRLIMISVETDKFS